MLMTLEQLINKCEKVKSLTMYEYEPGLWFLENDDNYIVASARKTDTKDIYYMLGYIEAVIHNNR